MGGSSVIYKFVRPKIDINLKHTIVVCPGFKIDDQLHLKRSVHARDPQCYLLYDILLLCYSISYPLFVDGDAGINLYNLTISLAENKFYLCFY